MSMETIKERIRAVRRRLGGKQIDCLVLTKPANVTYMTGFSGDDSWAIVTTRGVYLITDSRYIEQAQDQCSCCRIVQRTGPMAEAAGKLVRRLRSVRTVNVEKSISLAAFEALRKNVKVHVRSAANIIEEARGTKDKEEVGAIRAAAGLGAEALKQTLALIKPGVTENESAGELDLRVRRLGGRNSFDTIVAFGANGSRPHHQPGGRKLRKNDTILIDFGVRYKGYCCDVTRCFAVGKVSSLYHKAYKAVEEAQAAAIKAVKAGIEIRAVDAAAREVVAGYGLGVYGHGTGHGLGLEVHEEPVVSENSRGKLRAGMVFTIEPGVYMPGKLGVRIEDDILVTDHGCEILSSSLPHFISPAY